MGQNGRACDKSTQSRERRAGHSRRGSHIAPEPLAASGATDASVADGTPVVGGPPVFRGKPRRLRRRGRSAHCSTAWQHAVSSRRPRAPRTWLRPHLGRIGMLRRGSTRRHPAHSRRRRRGRRQLAARGRMAGPNQHRGHLRIVVRAVPRHRMVCMLGRAGVRDGGRQRGLVRRDAEERPTAAVGEDRTPRLAGRGRPVLRAEARGRSGVHAPPRRRCADGALTPDAEWPPQGPGCAELVAEGSSLSAL
jgi:hypothetical protein